MTRQILFLAVLLFPAGATFAGEGSRISHEMVAIGSSPLGDRGEDNGRFFRTSGLDHFELDLQGPIGAYSLINFSFSPRDLGLASVEEIVSAEVTFTTIVDARHAATEEIELFYTPETRRDFGVTLEDPTAYNLTYDDSVVSGIDTSQFKAAPVSLGKFEIEFPATEAVQVTIPLTFAGDTKTSLINRVNEGGEFHLVAAATSEITFARFESFGNNDLQETLRPVFSINATGRPAAGVTKQLIRQGAIHNPPLGEFYGDTRVADFYGSGNDDNFAEYGIAGFQFSRDDFGVAEDIEDIASVQLTLTHNDRSFSDGDMVEFLFTPDTAADLNFDETEGYELFYEPSFDNGIDDTLFKTAPISVGTYPYEAKFGGERDTFDLNFAGEAKELLLSSINAGADFHLLIAAPDPTFDITFSGLNNVFDPGNPELTIILADEVEQKFGDLDGSGALEVSDIDLLCSHIVAAGSDSQFDLNEDGSVNAEDVATFLQAAGSLPGDTDLSGDVSFVDFLVLSAEFGTEGDKTWSHGNLDCMGNVEFSDFLILSAYFGQSNQAAASVPEPAVLSLVGYGLLVAVASRRKRTKGL